MESNPYASNPQSIHAQGRSEAQITEGVISQLVRTKPWVRFFSVLTFLGAGLMLLIGLFMLIGGVAGAAMGAGSANPELPGFGGAMMAGVAVFYLLFALLYIYPALKLWKYANRIASLMYSRAEFDLEAALNEQRAFWKFAGISVIVLISLYLVGIAIFVISMGVAAAKIGGL